MGGSVGRVGCCDCGSSGAGCQGSAGRARRTGSFRVVDAWAAGALARRISWGGAVAAAAADRNRQFGAASLSPVSCLGSVLWFDLAGRMALHVVRGERRAADVDGRSYRQCCGGSHTFGRGSCGRQPGTSSSVCDSGLRLPVHGARSVHPFRFVSRHALAVRSRGGCGAVRLRGLLLSVPRAGRLRGAICLARFRHVPPRAGSVL